MPILFAISASQAKKLYQLQSVETSTIAQLEEIRAQMPGLLRPESRGQGRIRSATLPSRPSSSGAECVAYRIKLEREYEETRWEKDSNGNSVERTSRGFETVSTNERRAPFYLRDSTGRVKVVPDGADLVMEKSLSDYQSGFPNGQFSLGLLRPRPRPDRRWAGAAPSATATRSTSSPSNRDLYVLGEACDEGGEIKIRRSSTKGEKFILSVKSEEELVASAAGPSRACSIGAIASGVVGLALLAIGFVARR